MYNNGVGSPKTRILAYVLLNSKTYAYRCDVADIISPRVHRKEVHRVYAT